MIGPEPEDEPTVVEYDANDARAFLAALPDAVAISVALVAVALSEAVEKYPGRMHGPHEGLGVIYEEFIEFTSAVHANDRHQQRIEASHIAAMGTRFLLDVP